MQNGSRMNKSDFTNIFRNFDPLDNKTSIELEKLTKIYPYFQTAYFYYLKSLHKSENINYIDTLQLTSIKTYDRSILLNWLNDNHGTIYKKELNENPKINQKEKIILKKKSIENDDAVDRLNFLQWISLTEKSFEKRKFDVNSKKVESFIEKNPKIKRLEKKPVSETDFNIVLKNSFSPEELMTETLARIFIKQKKFDKAIQAFKILSLKYPEKNTLFANEIDKLIKLKNENT
ncbi:MAG: hypothetical protein CMC81_00585 [Flavobacteriaceae bacterium]|nr:hypothetical protein [Flavobacteriaceae bacterium]